jgi:hypothetical protein
VRDLEEYKVSQFRVGQAVWDRLVKTVPRETSDLEVISEVKAGQDATGNGVMKVIWAGQG